MDLFTIIIKVFVNTYAQIRQVVQIVKVVLQPPMILAASKQQRRENVVSGYKKAVLTTRYRTQLNSLHTPLKLLILMTASPFFATIILGCLEIGR